MRRAFKIACIVLVVMYPWLHIYAAPLKKDLKATCPDMARWQALHPHAIMDIDSHEPSPEATDKKLQHALIAAYSSEQRAITKAFADIGKGIKKSPAIAQWRKVNEENLKLIKAIVSAHGFPDPKLVGKDGTYAAFMLVQHADTDPAFQESMLPRLKSLYKEHVIPAEMYAYFTDRVMIARHKKQIYGTQFHIKGDTLVSRPIADPSHLSSRRESMGLPSMKSYECYVAFRSGKRVNLQKN